MRTRKDVAATKFKGKVWITVFQLLENFLPGRALPFEVTFCHTRAQN